VSEGRHYRFEGRHLHARLRFVPVFFAAFFFAVRFTGFDATFFLTGLRLAATFSFTERLLFQTFRDFAAISSSLRRLSSMLNPAPPALVEPLQSSICSPK